MMLQVMAVIGFVAFVVLAVIAVDSAYNNGCNDGYGYSKDPTNPGYQKAGRYLKKYCSHRWSELKEIK